MITNGKNLKRNNNYANHTTFYGELTIDDFNTSIPNKHRINNQADGLNLLTIINDNERKMIMEGRYKGMTIDKLRKMKLISQNNGRPSDSLTDEKWQEEFKIRKLLVQPYSGKIKILGGRYSRKVATWDEEKNGEYKGASNWQEYCAFINSVLRSIRNGEHDYCFYFYHIMDLLKFHHDDLRTKYCDGYFEVWLER